MTIIKDPNPNVAMYDLRTERTLNVFDTSIAWKMFFRIHTLSSFVLPLFRVYFFISIWVIGAAEIIISCKPANVKFAVWWLPIQVETLSKGPLPYSPLTQQTQKWYTTPFRRFCQNNNADWWKTLIWFILFVWFYRISWANVPLHQYPLVNAYFRFQVDFIGSAKKHWECANSPT